LIIIRIIAPTSINFFWLLLSFVLENPYDILNKN